MDNMASSPADPLLTGQTQPQSSPVAPVAPVAPATAPTDGYKFQIDGVDSSTNFL
ncbi:hypothetical protein E3U43_008449 [Larimichthys crocea]|uniref:Uncharacterized protein n=1 Tax=Larimichthys crocea TaxID=215358 RepID=A0ACD3RUM4_LARCR|nr:hypothetical protein E3U43_008449 [Larimichthys crocea]